MTTGAQRVISGISPQPGHVLNAATGTLTDPIDRAEVAPTASSGNEIPTLRLEIRLTEIPRETPETEINLTWEYAYPAASDVADLIVRVLRVSRRGDT